MSLRRKLSCLWTLGLYLVTTESLKVPSISDPHFIDECVKTHNEWRGKVSPPAADMKFMIWEEGLAKIAKGWADTCQFKHNTCLQLPFDCSEDYEFIGENIWLGLFKIFSPRDAIVAWYNETEHYDYDTLACSYVCGHYTQVVWASSYKVGCAIKTCPNLGEASTSIFICNYEPAGNYPNMPPYQKGASCSLCDKKEKCVKHLCRASDTSIYCADDSSSVNDDTAFRVRNDSA
ncbi:GLIPR1-like protein 1 [Lepus europaeus]|uniref:GLIPR1-like protein 1 n=1 Tax=Lepus europaeus TaxID=9983 RepID=UPI002B4A6758|nr:GLIPR1-like protein 1 [Lepus europaeus]